MNAYSYLILQKLSVWVKWVKLGAISWNWVSMSWEELGDLIMTKAWFIEGSSSKSQVKANPQEAQFG